MRQKNASQPGLTQNSQIGIDQMLKKVSKVLISGVGGGGDVLTALHVRWALEKIAPHVKWIQGGVTGAPITHFKSIEALSNVSAWVTEKSRSSPPHRLIEAVVARKLNEKVFLLSCSRGVRNMVNSLNEISQSENIEMCIFIDGGTDSLAFSGSAVISPVEDTMTLAALGLGEFSERLKYRVLGVSAVGCDGEMSLAEISNQLMKISRAGGYIGGTFFPVERLSEYSEILSEVLQEYPTATAQAPLLATSYPFKISVNCPYAPYPNGFQLVTFLFDAQITAAVGNDFTRLIFEEDTLEAAKNTLLSAL